jgi:replicative DNA helicase Mcm
LIDLTEISDSIDRFNDFAELSLKECFPKEIKNVKSIVVDFKKLEEWDSNLAQLVINEPDINLELLRKAFKMATGKDVSVSIKNLSTETKLRDVGANQIGKLIFVRGIVSRLIPPLPFMVLAAFECKRSKCGAITMVPQRESYVESPEICSVCHKKTKFKFREAQSKFVNISQLAIQERPEDLPAGQLPSNVKLEITKDDLIDVARAGDLVEVVGVVRTRSKSASTRNRVFDIHIDVNYIETLNKDISELVITPEEEQEIHKLAMDPNVHELIVDSIAPSIYGRLWIKRGIAYLLFGGIKRDKGDIVTRGEMNILLIGDPSTAKSQLLHAVVGISPRAVFASGRGASAAGLTAAVVKVDNMWTLEAGAVVLADKGICCIDEMDKMRPEDVTMMHEAMEQHTVSICKAGIVATLNARAAMLMACNPNFGRYDKTKTITENMNKLSVVLLSRFDLIFIVKDKLDPDEDKKLASHVLGLTGKHKGFIDRDLLRKYIAYARNINPVITPEANAYLEKYYLELREASGAQDNAIVITVRQLESLVRMTEAHAKMALKAEADVDDAKAAIEIMKKSMQEVGINPETNQVDIDIIMTGIPKTNRDKMGLILDLLAETDSATKEDIIEEFKKHNFGASEALKAIKYLMDSGNIFEFKSGNYKRNFG